MRKSVLFIIIAISAILLVACTQEKTATLVIDNIAISAEGPLFEGANTAQGEVINQLNEFAKSKGIDPAKIHHARLKNFTLSVSDSSSFDIFSSVKILLASDKSDMIEAASATKIMPASKLLLLTVASEQKDLLETLRQDKFIVVADAIIARDSNVNINMMGKMEIELKY